MLSFTWSVCEGPPCLALPGVYVRGLRVTDCMGSLCLVQVHQWDLSYYFITLMSYYFITLMKNTTKLIYYF